MHLLAVVLQRLRICLTELMDTCIHVSERAFVACVCGIVYRMGGCASRVCVCVCVCAVAVVGVRCRVLLLLLLRF